MAKSTIDRSNYLYLMQLSRSGFAWEFLRRNADYQRDWNIHRTAAPRPNMSREGIVFFLLNRRFREAERWGLRVFQDPLTEAGKVRLFWLPDALARSVEGRAALSATEAALRFRISDIIGARAVLVDEQGMIHVAIDSHHSSVGLSISDLPQPFSEFAVIFQLPAFELVKRRFEAILDLEWRTSRPLSEVAAVESRDVQSRAKLSNCIIAVDGRRHGLSYREIGRFLMGDEAVARDWNGPSRFLKDRIRRLVERGEGLVNGNYRDLLR
jgi:hypothetical protein